MEQISSLLMVFGNDEEEEETGKKNDLVHPFKNRWR